MTTLDTELWSVYKVSYRLVEKGKNMDQKNV